MRERFEHILRWLYLTSNATYLSEKKNPGFNLIEKTRWLLETLGKNFRSYLNPGPYVCVDELMFAYNGRYCGFKQYMPAKPIKHGLKLWALCCFETKYVFKLEVCVDASGEEPPELGEVSLGSGYSVVSRLCAGLDWKFYWVACDNYFTCPVLFETLYNQGIYAIGTALGNLRGFPNSLRMGAKNNEKRFTSRCIVTNSYLQYIGVIAKAYSDSYQRPWTLMRRTVQSQDMFHLEKSVPYRAPLINWHIWKTCVELMYMIKCEGPIQLGLR